MNSPRERDHLGKTLAKSKGLNVSIIEKLERTDHALKVNDLAKLLGMSRRTVYEHAAAGRIPGAIKIGSALRFNPSALAKWLREKGAE